MSYNRAMSIKGPFYLLLCVLLAAWIANAQTTIKQVSPKPTVAMDGKTLYHDYCAVCHGTDGKGTGPAASAIKPSPTDLTQIARKNSGSFPEERILRIIQGTETVTAHGSQDMPMWGAIFRNMNSNPNIAQARIHALLQYLENLQAK
jgi:mono/diheme cytochrome c family protein